MSNIKLHRAIGLKGAIMMGLGSIIGTGVFVSLGLAASLSGNGMLIALFLAGLLALCNALSTAQLAAAHPVSGGTYEYGYEYINPWMGFLAGWLFVCAKSASAATAAIGFGSYLISLFELKILNASQIGFVVVTIVIVLSLLGIRKSNLSNIIIVSFTIFALSLYIFSVLPKINLIHFQPFWNLKTSQSASFAQFFESIALLFVAYTGYGRIATLGEEIIDPQKNIPKAIASTLLLSFILYAAVAFVSLATVGSQDYAYKTTHGQAPLEAIARQSGEPIAAQLLAIAAMSAMFGVLLNLVLGISRVIFAMGKRSDLPNFFSKIEKKHHTPIFAILASGTIIFILVSFNNIKTTWSFSAFTVLIYYALTNISALRLPVQNRLYPRFYAWVGLLGCLGLSFWIEKQTFLLGLIIIIIGFILRKIFHATLCKS